MSISYSTFNDRSTIGDILDMVARNAPRLMRSAGGPLMTEMRNNNSQFSGRRITAERRAHVVVAEIHRQTNTACKTIRAICVAEGLAMPDGRTTRHVKPLPAQTP